MRTNGAMSTMVDAFVREHGRRPTTDELSDMRAKQRGEKPCKCPDDAYVCPRHSRTDRTDAPDGARKARLG